MYKIAFLIVLIFGLNNLFGQVTNTKNNNELLNGNKNNSKDKVNFIPAEPKGGLLEFKAFIYKKLKYPKDAKKMGVEGRVYVNFMIDENGEIPIDSIKVINPLFPSIDNEAIRLISKSPKWIPGTDMEGNPRITWMTFPINFTLKR